MLLDMTSWSNGQKAQFLAVLAHELTVSARGTYEVGTVGISNPKVLRAFNEIQHRVTASLRDYQTGKEGMPLSVVLEMLKNFGTEHDRKNDVERAIFRAQQLTIGDHLKPSSKQIRSATAETVSPMPIRESTPTTNQQGLLRGLK